MNQLRSRIQARTHRINVLLGPLLVKCDNDMVRRLAQTVCKVEQERLPRRGSDRRSGGTGEIYLPRVESEIRTIIQPHSVEHVANGCETLLLVEDEAAVRRSTREFLASSGYIVLEAENGQHALKIAREFKSRIHLMFTDVVMPQLGGAGLASQLAVDRPEMQVLFVSGYAENILRQGAIDVNARFLQKPFSLKALACKIREILDSKVPALVAAAAAAH